MSNFYRFNFTDGSFITMINRAFLSELISGTAGEVITVPLPNAYIFLATDNSKNIVKTDLAGNEWRFIKSGTRSSVQLNGTEITYDNNNGNYLIGYDDTNGSFSFVRFSGGSLPGVSMPGTVGYARIIDGNTGSTTYTSAQECITSMSDRIKISVNINVYGSVTEINTSSYTDFYDVILHIIIGYKPHTFQSYFYAGYGTYSGLSTYTVINVGDSVAPEYDIPDDPYTPGGTNDDDPDKVGGGGTFTDQDESMPYPGLPSLSAIDTGFVTLYNPSNAQLKSLANFLWSDLFSLDTLKKLFGDPMQAIVGLSIVPVQPSISSNQSVTLGNVNTGIFMPKLSNQYVTVDCGSKDVEEYWGAYIDYSPYTKAYIYLPYVGYRQLDIDDVMAKTVHVIYSVDVLTGACLAYVYSNQKIAYAFAGSCSSVIPVSGNDWTNVINGVLSAAGAIGATVATGGMAAPMAAGTIASAIVNSSKPTVEKSGGVSGSAGLLAYQKPALFLVRPQQAMSKNQYKYMGYPSWASRNISELSGYIEVEYVHLDSINATDEELDEIHQLLTTGVIV